MDGYIIRKAAKTDIRAIAEIYVKSWKFAYAGIVPDAYLGSLSVDGYLECLREKPEPDEYIFVISGSAVGLSRLIESRDPDPGSWAEVQTIYFLPEFTGRGLGVLFLDYLKKKAVSFGYDGLIVWVLTENIRARRAYEKAGFVKDKVKLVTIGGRDLGETRYSIRF